MNSRTADFPVLHHHPELPQTHVHWVSDAIQTSHPLSPLPLLPSIFPSIRVFSNESALHIRWPKYWSFSFKISLSNEYSGLISFSIDWFDFLEVQGTLYRVFSNTTVQKHQLFNAQPSLWSNSHPYITSGKTIALAIQTFVGKMMSLLFNMLSMFVIDFLPRGNHFLISWLQSPSAVILEHSKVKSATVSNHFPIYLLWSDGPKFHDSCFLNIEFKPTFSLLSFTFIKRLFSSSLLSAIRVVSSAHLRLLIVFAGNLDFSLSVIQHFAWCSMHRS